MLKTEGLLCGLYLRASLDDAYGSELEGNSVDGQDFEGRDAIEALGGRLVDVYNDNNLSSSEYRQKERKDWPRMLADVAAGRLQMIVMWDTSRGSRDLEDWVKFLKLIAKQGVLIHAVSHERTYNPQNHRDWEALAQDGVKNAAFSKQLSANLKRGNKRARRKGRPHGPAPFGWVRTYDPLSGKMLTQEPVPSEQVIVQEIMRRLGAGESAMSIARDLTERSRLDSEDPDWVPRTRRGNHWRHDVVKLVATSPVHIGKFWSKDTGKLADGNWSATVDETTWWSVRNLMMDPARTTTKPGKAKYLLTHIARCGSCNAKLGSRRNSNGIVRLLCTGKNDDGSPKSSPKTCVSSRMDWLDDYVLRKLAERMCKRELIAALNSHSTEEQSQAQAQALEMKAELEAYWAKVKKRVPGYTMERGAEMEAEWTPEIERLEEVANQGMSAGAILAQDLFRMVDESGVPDEDLVQVMYEALKDTPVGGLRKLLPVFFDGILLHPKLDNRRTFDERRVQFL